MAQEPNVTILLEDRYGYGKVASKKITSRPCGRSAIRARWFYYVIKLNRDKRESAVSYLRNKLARRFRLFTNVCVPRVKSRDISPSVRAQFVAARICVSFFHSNKYNAAKMITADAGNKVHPRLRLLDDKFRLDREYKTNVYLVVNKSARKCVCVWGCWGI